MIVAGFGFRSIATTESLRDALARAAGCHEVAALCAPEDKAQAACLHGLAGLLGLPVRAISTQALARCETPTRSPPALQRYGTGSVAEASALVGAGAGAKLLSTRCISADGRATCALALGGLR